MQQQQHNLRHIASAAAFRSRLGVLDEQVVVLAQERLHQVQQPRHVHAVERPRHVEADQVRRRRRACPTLAVGSISDVLVRQVTWTAYALSTLHFPAGLLRLEHYVAREHRAWDSV